ncbi:MAG: DUF1080 domain-containing protein, partial [Candidatus Hydrogenedentes bacterium]|nr:DUF1080 domain-containing protein [Candidatus Hydrogenedentota bacterium]
MNRMYFSAGMMLCLGLCVVSGTTTEQDEPGFKEIFDGATLAGWSAADMSFWSIEDGAITAKITPEHPTERNHYLVYEGGKLGDFELKLLHRIASPHE